MPQNAESEAAGQTASCSKWINDFFREHPAAAGETYVQHLLFTLATGWFLLVTAIILVVHGLLPRFFQTTASDRIIHLADITIKRRENVEQKS
jgi:hypothetical protein